MSDIKYVLKWLAVGLVGALWLYCASFPLPEHTRLYLGVIGTITSAFSIANLVSRLPKFSRTRKTAGGDPNQKGLAEVPEGNQVSAPAERGSDSVQSGPAPEEQASIEVRVVPATNPEPLRKPTDIGFSYWSD